MELDLKNKVVVITGVAHGLGRALALSVHKQGATVVGHYKNSQTEAEGLQKELARLSLYQADLRDPAQTKKMFAKILADHGRVDILINNVGNFIYKPFEETSGEDLRDVVDTNLYASMDCAEQVLPGMKERKSGQIINLGCAGADRVVIRELTTPYYIAKTGVIMLTKIMARTYAPYGIRINAISPGILETSIASPVQIPAGRRAQLQDIVSAVLFLLSSEAEYINGANLEVAGGWTP